MPDYECVVEFLKTKWYTVVGADNTDEARELAVEHVLEKILDNLEGMIGDRFIRILCWRTE